MKSPSIREYRGISTLWGLIDVCAIALYVTLAMKREKVPIFSDLFDAAALKDTYESAAPVAIALAGCVLLVTLPISAYLMLRNKRSGLYLASAQLPLRVALIVPSVFFLNHLPLFHHSTAAFLAAFLGSESVKLWSLYTYAGHRTPHATGHPRCT